VEDIMTIAYAGVVTIGTFVNSILIIVIGIVLFVAHTLLSFLMYRYYERKYGAANARRVENQYVDKEQRDQYN
jgi:NADH:ubiquinone oxidoreductase subunit H